MSVDLARVRELREACGLSQAAVAEQLGYSSAVGYCRLETGQRRLRAEHLARLAEIFDVNVGELLITKKASAGAVR